MSVVCPIYTQHRTFSDPFGSSHLYELGRGAFAAEWLSGTAPVKVSSRCQGPLDLRRSRRTAFSLSLSRASFNASILAKIFSA